MRTRRSTPRQGVLALALLCGPYAVAAQSVPATRLQQLPTTELMSPGAIGLEGGFTTTFGGQVAGGGGGSGNQTYQAWVDLGLHDRVMLTSFFDFNDDPTFGLVAGRRWQKDFTAFGSGLRVLLGEVGPARLVVDGSVGLFGVISEAGLFTTDPNADRDYFAVGTLSAVASAEFAPEWSVTLTPSLTYLPKDRAGVAFFGWTTLLGVGVDGKPHSRWRVFATAESPLGPGNNSLEGDFDFRRTLLWSAGAVYESSPRVQLIGYLTNQSGATPVTRHLTLLGEVPTQYGARLRWLPTAPERDRSNVEARDLTLGGPGSSSLGPLGGIQTPLAPALGAVTVDVILSLDDSRSRSLSVRVGVSDELDLEVGLARTPDLGSESTLGINLDGGTHYRVGAKLTLASEDWGSPLTIATRFSGGQDIETNKGYFMAEALVRRGITRWAQVTVAPVFAQNGAEVPVALGLSGVLGHPGGVQFILEPTFLLTGQSSLWTVGLRPPPVGPLHPQLFVTTARSMLGIGRLLGEAGDVRVGAMARVRFR